MASPDWVPIVSRAALEEPGDYVSGKLPSGREIAAWVLRDGSILVFDGICPHRGTRLACDASGRADLRCPLHGLSEAAIARSAARYTWEWRDGVLWVADPG